MASLGPKNNLFSPTFSFFLGLGVSTRDKKTHSFWLSIASRAMCRKKRILGGAVLYYISLSKQERNIVHICTNKSPTDSGSFSKSHIARVKMMRKDRLRRNICFPLCWSSPRSNYVPPVKTQYNSTLLWNISLLSRW